MWIMKKTRVLLTTKSILIVTLILISQIVLSEDSGSCPDNLKKKFTLVGNLCVSESIDAATGEIAADICKNLSSSSICSRDNWESVICDKKSEIIPNQPSHRSFWLNGVGGNYSSIGYSQDCKTIWDITDLTANAVLCCLAPLKTRNFPAFPPLNPTTTTTTIPKSNSIMKRGAAK